MEATLSEPTNDLVFISIWVIPFLCYFLGVYIRKATFNENSPELSKQLLMAIPVCLVVVAPIVATLDKGGALSGSLSNYLFTLGVIIEHGMLMQKKLTEHLQGLAGNG